MVLTALILLVCLSLVPNVRSAPTGLIPTAAHDCSYLGSASERTQFLIYNRIPKCGSTTTINVFRHFTMRGHVHEVQLGASNQMMQAPFEPNTRWQTGWQRLKSASLEAETKHLDGANAKKHMVINHMYFANFSEHLLPQPLYFQIMRDPVERELSEYNYLMYGPRDKSKMIKIQMDRKEFVNSADSAAPPSINEFVEKYVEKFGDGCTSLRNNGITGFVSNTQTRFFCGFHSDCDDICSPAALARAMHVLEHDYLAVGVLEHLEETLQLLDLKLPGWFPGIVDVYKRDMARYTNENDLGARQTNVVEDSKVMTAKTRASLEKIQGQDIQLYQFAKKLLMQTLQQCSNNMTNNNINRGREGEGEGERREGESAVDAARDNNEPNQRTRRSLLESERKPELYAEDPSTAPKCGTKGIKFFKLHKVGSTTAANLLEKYGKTNDLKVCKRTSSLDMLRDCDLTITHDGSEYLVAKQKSHLPFFEDVLSGGITAGKSGSISVVVLRDPRERVLSRYYYDIAINQGFNNQGMSREEKNIDSNAVELHPFDNLREWLKNRLESEGNHYLKLSYPKKLSKALVALSMFDVVGTSERMDAMATTLALKLGCNYSDFVYSSEKVVVGRPTFADLPQDIQDTITEGTVQDMHVYKAAQTMAMDIERRTPAFDRSYKEFQNLMANAGPKCTFKRAGFHSKVNLNLPDCFEFQTN